MKTGIVVDSVCDLPRAFLDAHHIEVLPVTLHFGDRVFEDTRDPDATKALYREYLAQKKPDFSTRAPDTESIVELFLERLVLRFSKVIVITCSGARSRLFENATQASFALLKSQRHRRQAAGLPGGFALRVADSKSLYAGEAIVAHEAVRLCREQPDKLEATRLALEHLGEMVVTYLAPQDPFYLRFRAREKGERSVGTIGYLVARLFDLKPVILMRAGKSRVVARPQGFDQALAYLFDQARDAISSRLHKPLVAMSYAGEPTEISELPAYKSFAAFAEGQGIELMLSVMSATSGVNVGPGAFSLAFASST